MKILKTLWLGVSGLLLLVPAVVAKDIELADAKQAVAQLQQQKGLQLAYERLSQFGERTLLERYQADTDDHGWQLLAENGQAPSEQRLREYAQMKHDEWQSGQQPDDEEQGDQQSVKLSLSDLIQPETLAYAGEQQWQGEPVAAFTFTPQLDKFSEHNDKLQGFLYLDADNSRQIKGLTVGLKEEFSPAMSVTLERFQLTIELMPLQQGQHTYFVPHRTEEQMAGSYLYFKDFNNHTVRTYRDYSVLEKPALSN